MQQENLNAYWEAKSSKKIILRMQFLEFKDKDLRQITLSTASLHRVYKLQLAEYERNSDLYKVVFTAL